MIIRRLARPLLATTFVVDGVDTLRHPEPRTKSAAALVSYGERKLPAQQAAKLPDDPRQIVRVNAAVQVGAGALLAIGRVPRLASLALAATVVPDTVTEQDFWNEPDPDLRDAKRTAFLKDLGLLGGLMIAAADTEGKPSLGWRGRRAARRAGAALPTATTTTDTLRDRLQQQAVHGRELAQSATTKGAELAEAAQERGGDWAEAARHRGAELIDTAEQRGPVWAEAAKHRSADLAEVTRKRGEKWAEQARRQGAELRETAEQRGPEWAEAARQRRTELAEVAQHRGEKLARRGKDRGGTTQQRGRKWADRGRLRSAEMATQRRKARGRVGRN